MVLLRLARGGSSTFTALGRQEDWEDSPDGYPQAQPYGWWNLHDEPTVFEAALSEATASQRGSRSRS